MEATLLTKRWFERHGRLVLEYWVRLESGAARLVFDNESSIFFVKRDVETMAGVRREVQLQSMDGEWVSAVYFSAHAALLSERKRLIDAGHQPLEADISPSDRYLMERFITGTMMVEGESRQNEGAREWLNPVLRVGGNPHTLTLLSFDIETEGLHGRILSIAGVCGETCRVWVDRPELQSTHFESVEGEAALIRAFERWVIEIDPDVITGWNVIGFDLRVLLQRAKEHGFELKLGRGRGRTRLRETERRSGALADIEGRVVLDGRQTLQASGYYAESYSLENTSQALLGEGKSLKKVTDKAAEILRLYHESPDELAIYNLKDCELVKRIFESQDLLGFVTERQQLTGLAMDRIGGSVAAFDYLYLPRLHRKGRVARTIDSEDEFEASPGGYVMDSRPGLFQNVLVLDFKSLYPSIIRTFKIDPFGLVSSGASTLALTDEEGPMIPGLVPGFRGAVFDPLEHILPALIQDLWNARDEAKRRKDTARSTAIKILMNSFYGVLGTTGCRFFDTRLASSVTLRGHQIILESKAFIERAGFEVVYGDTDSVFVHVGSEYSPAEAHAIGVQLTRDINAFWRQICEERYQITSHLEMEFETLYARFFMPTKRHSDEGSKKRYAGWIVKDGVGHVEVKGMEAVRTDWTRLARNFQMELFRRVFSDELGGLETWILGEIRAVREGRRDNDLVYTKRLRRPASEYTNTPPHVAAAIILGGSPRRISYFMTSAGAQPVSHADAPIDYEHYVEKQLKPSADAILEHVGIAFDRLADRQGWLF